MVLAVIPARFASTRFPGKPLVEIRGKSMIHRVFEQVGQAKTVDKIIVATDDARIFDHVLAFGGQAMLTDLSHPSGTDRCAEVARKFPGAEIVLNVQGDEPFIQPQQIDFLTVTLKNSKKSGIATLAKKIDSSEALQNPNLVKVVFSKKSGEAIYFSRHPIPFLRGVPTENWIEKGAFFKHIGLYAFRAKTLLKISKLKPSPLEIAESLEQLRWLENGLKIAVGITDLETFGIDTPKDLERLNSI